MKSVLNIHWKDWCWCWNSNTLATWCEKLTHWKRPWCWERLKVGGEGDDRRWDGWMASPTWWTWVWASSGSWWRTGKPGMLQSMGLQELNTTERLNWTVYNNNNWNMVIKRCSYLFAEIQSDFLYRMLFLKRLLNDSKDFWICPV